MPALADYRLDVYDDAGDMRGTLTGTAAGGSGKKSGFLTLSCLDRVNSPGLLTVNLRGDHPLLENLADKWQFEMWRRPLGYTWRREFTGLFRTGQWSYGEKSSIVLYCPGILALLKMRIVNWPASISNRTVFTSVPGETIMKTLATYNITSSATTGNGRKRNGTNWPATQISIEADGGNGNSLDWYCHGQVLLESLQKLADIAGGDFDLVKTSPTSYELRWYTGQLGDDLSSTVRFSLGLGNMGNPEYVSSRTDEATVACVWGQGEDSDRDYATRTGANYAANNDIEVYINATDVEKGNTAGLEDRGDQKLRELEAIRSFRFRALQAPKTLYGVHYDKGDLVGVINPSTGDAYTQKVMAITHALDQDGRQEIGVELGAP